MQYSFGQEHKTLYLLKTDEKGHIYDLIFPFSGEGSFISRSTGWRKRVGRSKEDWRSGQMGKLGKNHKC